MQNRVHLSLQLAKAEDKKRAVQPRQRKALRPQTLRPQTAVRHEAERREKACLLLWDLLGCARNEPCLACRGACVRVCGQMMHQSHGTYC